MSRVISRGGKVDVRRRNSKFQERPKVVDQVIRKNQQLMKRWDERLHIWNLDLANRWLTGKLVFAIKVSRKQSGEMRWFICMSPEISRNIQATIKESVSEHEEMTVLVGDVEKMNPPKRIVAPSIRLECINSLLGIAGHACYFFISDGFVLLEGLPNREPAFIGGSIPIPVGKFPCQMVQSRAKIVNSVSRIRKDFYGKRLGWFGKENVVLRITERGYSLDGFSGILFSVEDVMFGPFGLYSNDGEFNVS